jgi:hypothetical protein
MLFSKPTRVLATGQAAAIFLRLCCSISFERGADHAGWWRLP